jgi:hypothetical protein
VRVRLFALLTLASCTCGREEERSIAELVRLVGDVDRDFAASAGVWEDAERGARFGIGDGVRTGASARATLSLHGSTNIEMEPSTELRFQSSDTEDARVDIATGSATLEAGDEEGRVETELGVAVLEPGTRMRLSPDGLTVLVGLAVVETDDGARPLVEGESIGSREEPAAGEARVPDPPPRDPIEEPIEEPVGAPIEGDTATVATTGRVERADGDRWRPVAPGEHELAPGTRLRLARGATATIEHGDDRVRAFGAGDVVVAPREGELLEALGGRAHVEAVSRELRVRVPGGVIVASVDDGPSSGEVRITDEATVIEAERGRIVVAREGEEEAVLGAGEDLRIDRGRSAIGAAELVLRAGGSVVVHDPSPPIVVRFEVPDCDDGAIEIDGHRAAAHRLARGRHAYTMRCGDDRVGTGRVSVLRDTGQSSLPRAPPASIVDADGRSYTVLYQNQLPVITVRWRDAPAADSYRLSFVGGTRAAVVTQQPRFAFASGDLGDGTHRFVVEAGGARSAATTVAIRFDNAAPAARVEEPSNGTFAAGERVRVRGAALPGWTVAVAGADVALDGANRFQTEATAPDGPLVIRLSHPRHGVHYYLRRPR